MQQVVKFDERLLSAMAVLQPVGFVKFAKVAQRVDSVSYANVRGAYT